MRQFVLRMLWALPVGVHTWIARWTGWRLVNQHPVDDDGLRPVYLRLERW